MSRSSRAPKGTGSGEARPGAVHLGDAREVLERIAPDSIALSVWSPPYFVGKSYERDLTYDAWRSLLEEVIVRHARVLRPGAFLAVNVADILCFPDPSIPRIQAENLASGNRLSVTRGDVERVLRAHPGANRYRIAGILGVSEQTVDRRLKGNNIRGGKRATQTCVRLVGPVVEEAARAAGLPMYDRRVWVKDPCWENCRWHTNSYRAVDEFEYVYVFWKPGITRVDRRRLARDDWARWGSAKFPLELPRRLIRLLTDPGDIVLDCFMGSGTTAVAAIMEGRRFLGIERSPGHAAQARLAIAAARSTRRQSGAARARRARAPAAGRC
jgi:hypothetical protein